MKIIVIGDIGLIGSKLVTKLREHAMAHHRVCLIRERARDIEGY